MASITDIANMALDKMGQAHIADVTANDPNARRINSAYPNILKGLLVDGPERGWTFTRGRATLTVSATTPDFGYDYQYDLPADCLKVVSVTVEEEPLTDWIREGNILYTNETNEGEDLIYIKNVTDFGSLPPYFVELFALAIAKTLCFSIKGDEKREAALVEQYEMLYRNRAKGLDMREMYVEDYNTLWIDAGR